MPVTPTYEELAERVQALERAEREREEARKREEFLLQILQSVRNINRIMVEESDPYALIHRACENLTETPGYLSAWIALLDQDGTVKVTASSGWQDSFKVMQEKLEQGRFPDCTAQALEKDDFVVVRDAASECLDCPLSGIYRGRAVLIRRLTLEGTVYGVLSVAVPRMLAQDEEIQNLFHELTRDLACALKRIEDSESLRLANEIILRSPAVAFVWEKAEGWPVRFASENTGRLFGWAASDFMSGTIQYRDVVYPDDLKRVFREVAEAYKDPETSTILHAPYRIVRKDGDIRWIDDMTFIRRSGMGEVLEFQGILLDVTKRMRAEEVSEIRQIQLRSLFEYSGEAIVLLDPQNRVQEVNRAFERVFGFSPKEAEGKVIQDLICPERFYQIESKELDEMSLRGIKGIELIRKRRDGREIDVRVSAGPIKAEARLLGRFVVFDDITEQKRTGEELRQYRERLEHLVESRTRDLRNAQEALLRKEKLSVLGQLAGGVGHELRNPLGAIKNAVYFLNMALESPEDEIRDTLKILKREVKSSERIIQALFDYADPKGPKRIDGVDLKVLIRETLDRIQVPENVAVALNFDDDLPAARVDPDLIEQVIGNLVRNGIQAMGEGGRLFLEAKMEPSNQIRIRVSDTGVGIPEENLNKIFEPLFTTKAKGIGLGLALCKGHVEAHGGTLEVERGEGLGTTFTVRLPAAQ